MPLLQRLFNQTATEIIALMIIDYFLSTTLYHQIHNFNTIQNKLGVIVASRHLFIVPWMFKLIRIFF